MKGTHLTLEDRKTIQCGLEDGLSKVQIVRDIEKSPSTITKEVKLHRKLKPANPYQRGIRYYCANGGNFKQCHGCKKRCEHFTERICKRQKRIGVCNKCPDKGNCHLDKYLYHAIKAHEEYIYTLSDARQGVNMTSSQMITMAQLIEPLLKRGQSVYQIRQNHVHLH